MKPHYPLFRVFLNTAKMASSSSPLNEWQAIADYHRTQLGVAENKVNEMTAPAVPADVLLTEAEMIKRVLAMETRKGYKTLWKKAVVDYTLLRNVQHILDECYSYLRDPEVGDALSKKARRLTGKRNSSQWQLFTLRVIEHLKNEGSFDDADGGFDSFEDTAGGCDETTQDAAFWVIDNSE